MKEHHTRQLRRRTAQQVHSLAERLFGSARLSRMSVRLPLSVSRGRDLARVVRPLPYRYKTHLVSEGLAPDSSASGVSPQSWVMASMHTVIARINASS